ncbi:LysR substrate-binding domain-containing protein, partial [Escherichia coli]|uniref:LysR substrate-binding domain-containing protein n=2 Tax=Escherichia coli TaxID=562 RepID=UPI001F2C4DFC
HAFSSGAGRTSDGNGSHASTLKSPSYTKSVSWQHYRQLLLNTIDLIIDAAIDGHGLAYLPYDQVERAIKEKKLIRVLDKFTPDLPGYHLYYPHRRHAGSAFSLFIDRLKYKGAV